MSAKPTYSYLAYEIKILNFILSLDAFTTAESKIATPEKFFASRDFLNQRLLNEISKTLCSYIFNVIQFSNFMIYFP